jgi:outer membrane protein
MKATRLYLSVVTVAGIAAAQAPPTPKTLDLTLKRAAEIATAPDGNLRVSLALQAIEEADAKAREARSAFLPTIDGQVSERSNTTNLQTFGFTFPTVPGFAFSTFVGPYGVFDARASAQQSVLDLSVVRRYRAAQASASAARLDSTSARNQVSDQIARAYLGCQRADAALDSVRSDVELSEALLKLANSQKNAGTGTGIEVTRAQVQLSNDHGRLTVAENDLSRTSLQLMRAMGIDMDVTLHCVDKLALTPVDEGPIPAAIEKARKDRAELKTQRQKVEAARLSYSAVKAERLPTVGAFGDYGPTGPSINNSRATRTVGVSLKISLFDGGRRMSRAAESMSQYDQEQLRARDLERQVELEVRLAFDALNSARTLVNTANESLTLAESELAQARRRYEAGVTNSIEVTDAQTRVVRARDNRVASLYNYNLARLDLATSTGAITEFVNQ